MRQQTIVDTQGAAGLLFGSAGKPQTLVRELVEPFAAVASVYCSLDESIAAIDGAVDRSLRIGALIEQLRPAGAPDVVIETIRDRVLAQPAAPATKALFVDGDGNVMLDARLDMPTADLAVFTAPAEVRPLLRWHQQSPAHLVVAVDRAGADIIIEPGRGEQGRTITVTGPDDEIENNAPGGWAGLSQSRFQNRAEDSWHHNAAFVAKALVDEAAAIDAEVVVLTGDVRAVQLVEAELPVAHTWQLRTISGGRSADGSQATRRGAVADALREVADEKSRWLVTQLLEQVMPGGLGVVGARDTLEALAGGRVAVLLVAEDLTSGIAWFGEAGTAVFSDGEAASATGQPVRTGSLPEVAVRSALMSGARVRVIPADTEGMPAEGIAALCRYAS